VSNAKSVHFASFHPIITPVWACRHYVFVAITLLYLGLSSLTSLAQENVQTEETVKVYPAEISFNPKTLTLTMDTASHVVGEVKVLNRGGTALNITGVTPSCYCARGTMMSNPIEPMTIGILRIQINTSGLKDSINRIEYVVQSNAATPKVVYSVIIRNPQFGKSVHTPSQILTPEGTIKGTKQRDE
jgi:hypothetical protein